MGIDPRCHRLLERIPLAGLNVDGKVVGGVFWQLILPSSEQIPTHLDDHRHGKKRDRKCQQLAKPRLLAAGQLTPAQAKCLNPLAAALKALHGAE